MNIFKTPHMVEERGIIYYRIAVTPMEIKEKTCSLTYNNQAFTVKNGVFTNIVPHKTYPANEVMN